MEDDTTVAKSSPKNFFQTLPGIITGIAAIITALGGFILALNQTGCFGARSTDKVISSENSVHKVDNVAGSNTNAGTKDERSSVENKNENIASIPKATWSKEPVNYLAQKVSFTLKDVTVQSLPNNEVFLQVTIKCVNESNSIFNWGPRGIRIKVGDDRFSPDDSSPSNMQSVNSLSFKNFIFNFKLPANSKAYSILFYDQYEGTEIGNAAVQIL